MRPKCAGANQLLVDVGLSVEALSRLNASPNPYDDYTEFDDFGAQK